MTAICAMSIASLHASACLFDMLQFVTALSACLAHMHVICRVSRTNSIHIDPWILYWGGGRARCCCGFECGGWRCCRPDVDRNPESQLVMQVSHLWVESCNQTRTNQTRSKPSEASVITQPRANRLSMKNQCGKDTPGSKRSDTRAHDFPGNTFHSRTTGHD